MAYTYSIYGAGATSENPIIVQIDQAACESKFVAVPYIIKGEDAGCDGKTVFFNNVYYPSADKLTDLVCSCSAGAYECNKWEEKWTSGDKTFTDTSHGETITIHYKVEVLKDCEKKPGCDTGCTIGSYWIKKAKGKSITVSYEKYIYKDCDTIERKVVTTTKTCGDGDITIDTGCGSFSFPYKCTTPCENPGSTKIVIRGATFTPVTVEYDGGKIKVSLSYEKIVIDTDCTEHKARGSFMIDVTVPACTDKCCFDHPVEVKIPKKDILTSLGISDQNTQVIYKNKAVGENLILSIIQKANPGPECDKNCEYKTTYCVSGSSVKVEYETFWGSKDWTGTEVSSAGGRVRVSFDYLATAVAIDENGKPLTDKDGYQLNPDGTYKQKDGHNILETVCKPYEFNGNDYVIIEVPPCVAEESAQGTGEEKIPGEILYKERTSGCVKTCAEGGALPCVDEYEYTDVVTKEKYKMNLIKYEVKQSCTGICEPGTYKVYEEVPGNAGKCDTTFTGRAKYKTITVDSNCKVTTSEEAYEDMTVQISPNQTTNVVEIVNDYFRITQEAGPCNTGNGCGCEAVEIIGGNYPDVCTSPTYKYEDVHITCEPHEMVEVPFSGLCDGVVVASGKYKWTGHFECNSGDSITHTREANGATMKVLQDGGCDCYEAEGGEHVVPGDNPGPGPGPGPSPGPDPKPTDCVTPLDNVGQVCDDSTTATQEFIDEGYACDGGHWWDGPLDGENDEGFNAAGDTTEDGIRCSTNNLEFEYVDNWITYTVVPEQRKVHYDIAANGGSKPRHGILKVRTKENEHPDREYDGHSTSDYFCTKWCNIHFYQKGNGDVPGPTPECTKPSPSSGLDTMLSQCNFEQVLGCYVTPDDTPCTYTYLKAVYESSSGLDTTKSWMIANVFSELTPYDDMASDYFEEAAKTYGGLGKDLYRDKFIYEERIEGAFEYAKFKYNNYSSSQEMAANARAELQDKGITKAKLRPRLHPEKSNPIYFNRNEGVHMLPIIPSSAPSNAAGSSDVTYTQNLINSYFVASDCEQAIKDKAGCGAYLASIMNVNDGDGRYTDFIDMVTDLADAGNNQIKYDSDPHRRWRPGAQQKLTRVFTIPPDGDSNVYLCDCTIQAASYAMCGENCNCTDDVDSFTNTEEFTNGNASFPSGHSAKAYLAFLCCVEVDGNFGDKSRILDYCENRTVVRAHWITDVTAGRLGASMQIGYLNGFEEYHKLIRNM